MRRPVPPLIPRHAPERVDTIPVGSRFGLPALLVHERLITLLPRACRRSGGVRPGLVPQRLVAGSERPLRQPRQTLCGGPLHIALRANPFVTGLERRACKDNRVPRVHTDSGHLVSVVGVKIPENLGVPALRPLAGRLSSQRVLEQNLLVRLPELPETNHRKTGPRRPQGRVRRIHPRVFIRLDADTSKPTARAGHIQHAGGTPRGLRRHKGRCLGR